MSKATKNLAELREARLQGNFPASQNACDEPDGDFEVGLCVNFNNFKHIFKTLAYI
jgi:hypothetical protein